ncbi:DUF6049 family protein [Frondihabitans australicus]|uniref:Uncharacterized protein n=1 Tax=Frondihabitans australicus TaxID=386892 RepID=A0A495IJF2_9MICO|nr:DUF6049 family protein [Frondihabitans australicus]RKR75840.1 hypothetical protein C8E83_3001 [Frondihabitans australicus]
MRTVPALAVAALAALALTLGLPGSLASADTGGPSAAAGSGTTTSAGTTSPSATATPTAGVTTAAASSANPITVDLSPANDGVVKTDQGVTATVTVHNGTSKDLGVGYVNVFLDRATFASRSALEAWFDRSDDVMTDTLGVFMTSVNVPAIKAGATSAAIKVTLPADTVALNGSDWGAKAFGARYSIGDTPLSEVHSSVVYYPNDSFEATNLAIAVPITVPESTSGLISSDALASYTSSNGILTQELDAVRGKPVAIGIDPMILASIRILGNDAPPSAVVWLKRLETAPNQTFGLAYADADLSALSQAGADQVTGPIDFASEIAAQQKKDPDAYKTTGTGQGATSGGTSGNTDTTGGNSSGNGSGTGAGDKNARSSATSSPTDTSTPSPTQTTIPPTTTTPTTRSLLAFGYTMKGVAWPVDDTVASGDLGVITKSGNATTILSSSNVKMSGSTTENAAATVSGEHVLVSDDTLSGLLRDASTAGDDTEFSSDMAQLSSELATLTHERPSDSRTLFATLGRNWATTGTRFGDALTALSKLTWVKTVSLQAAASAESSSASLVSRSASDSRVDALTPLVKAEQQLDQFATALATPATVTAKTRLRALALSSTAWADNPSGLASEIGQVGSQVATTITQVKVVEGSTINILGDRTSLPIVVQNDTDSAATVLLRVVPSNYYLSVEKNDLSVTIQPNSQQRVTVPVQSVANGKVTLTLSLTSNQGVAISTPSQVSINVQAGWETAITLIFGIAVVLLFGGGIYRSIRRRRRAAAEATQGAGAADTPTTPAASADETARRP